MFWKNKRERLMAKQMFKIYILSIEINSIECCLYYLPVIIVTQKVYTSVDT